MNLGVQYYRAPFPDEKYWAEDFARIRDSGLNTVQLWVLWAWVESKPGEFRFDDYDRLIELAERNGLGVVLSTIAEIQPYWIHREVPGSEMIDHMGRRVVSSTRGECHFGITPGGCTDHPRVWERMERFLGQVATRYRSIPHVRGWDAWNETRWNIQSDGLVCFCEHTLAAFRGWLDEKYGGLDGLNAAWKRRYGRWDDVMPGKFPRRPFTESMAFQHFLTCRSDRLARRRYEVIKSIVPDRPVTVHGPSACPLLGGVSYAPSRPGGEHNHALNRGNDWSMADGIDGIGCSSFPVWFGMDPTDFAANVEFIRSAAGAKRMWLSELQGGRAVQGYWVADDVRAAAQQRWLWNGIAAGADTILFWCWRDEVFGKESSGFGLAGDDGFADERLAAMKTTGRLVETHRELLDAYRPLPARVGVLFSPQAYYLDWSEEGTAVRAMKSLQGYCRALVRNAIPHQVVEEEHLDRLGGLDILFVPRAPVVDPHTEAALAKWVRAGGTLVCESEYGAFDSCGLYHYPEDRLTARLTGAREIGRRQLQTDRIRVEIDGQSLQLRATQWLTPWQSGAGRVLATSDAGPVVVEFSVGSGRLVACGSYFGEAYYAEPSPGFERFVDLLVRNSGWRPDFEVVSPRPTASSSVYVRLGEAAGRKMAFVFLPEDCEEADLRFRPGFFSSRELTDLMTDSAVPVEDAAPGQRCAVRAGRWQIAVLVES